MRKDLLLNILWITIAVAIAAFVLVRSNKQDKIDGKRFDDCLVQYKSQGIPTSAYEAVMKPCMDQELKSSQ